MSKADKMFLERGYKKTESEGMILYTKFYSEKESYTISFNLDYGTISACYKEGDKEYSVGIRNTELSMIIKKSKELCW